MQPNQKVGRLTLLELRQEGKTKKWLCRCDCGTEKEVNHYYLTSKRTTSCGCLSKELKNRLMSRTFPRGAA